MSYKLIGNTFSTPYGASVFHWCHSLLERKVLKGFTERYGLHKLIYFEVHQYVNDATIREKQLKKWERQRKINLIEEENPNWNDLASDWYS